MLFLICMQTALAGVGFGSYGRVQVSTDAMGGQGDPVNVVTYGSRLEKDPYLELDVLFDHVVDDGAGFKVVVTPAISGALFHYDGQWGADLALRNLYVEARDFTPLPLSAWAGSRMVRGDDVHLMDFWPLDELNMVGAGARVAPEGWEFLLHAGLNRLEGDDWQLQVRDIPKAGGVGQEPVILLDRQRRIVAAKASRFLATKANTVRFSVYGELHSLPEGVRVVDDFVEQTLPTDFGAMAGIQLSAWGWAPDSFAHLWYKAATGLAAGSELALPTGLGPDYRMAGAREHLWALAANHEAGRVGVMGGAYLRRYTDADASAADVDDRWEFMLAVRPSFYATDHLSLGVEASHQWLRPDGLNPRTDAYDLPQVTKLALLPAIQPRRGGLARPQLRLQYVLTVMNNDARSWYAESDTRHRSNVQHFIGVGAEWWLNSATYRLAGQSREER
ncbi:MAG: carbohydrate porin [Alphaproteobacteria bacterium]|nr:carbohydrate porin [Alphaproteobacteria bacterium]